MGYWVRWANWACCPISTMPPLAKQVTKKRKGSTPKGEPPEELIKRKWEKLSTFLDTINEVVIKEFYANTLLESKDVSTRKSFVNGKHIKFDSKAINCFLGINLGLGEIEDCTHAKWCNKEINHSKRAKEDSEEALKQPYTNVEYFHLFQHLPMLLYIGFPYKVGLHSICYYGMDGHGCRSVIPQEMHLMETSSSTTRLGFPALNTEICKKIRDVDVGVVGADGDADIGAAKEEDFDLDA
ncbi:hypothetical protein E2542_SST12873 [Spatholobus suberectus]|nr:hypothetical protein E2542_SST12873 [Spatholobus suberectus]